MVSKRLSSMLGRRAWDCRFSSSGEGTGGGENGVVGAVLIPVAVVGEEETGGLAIEAAAGEGVEGVTDRAGEAGEVTLAAEVVENELKLVTTCISCSTEERREASLSSNCTERERGMGG